jgi:hypothetical protein
MIAAEDAPIHRLLAEAAQTGSGSAPFGTDGGWLSRLGLDCVLCGPGRSRSPTPNDAAGGGVRPGGRPLTRVVHRACTEAPGERAAGHRGRSGRGRPPLRAACRSSWRGGRIDAVTAGRTATDLHPRAALLPGFINVHSHAFQRGLGVTASGSRRYGRLELAAGCARWSSGSRGRAVPAVPAGVQEMLDAGVTVGEFHHAPRHRRRRLRIRRVVLDAATAAGIRIVLSRPTTPPRHRPAAWPRPAPLPVAASTRTGGSWTRAGARPLDFRASASRRTACAPPRSRTSRRCTWRRSGGATVPHARRGAAAEVEECVATYGPPAHAGLSTSSTSPEPDRGALHPHRRRRT